MKRKYGVTAVKYNAANTHIDSVKAGEISDGKLVILKNIRDLKLSMRLKMATPLPL